MLLCMYSRCLTDFRLLFRVLVIAVTAHRAVSGWSNEIQIVHPSLVAKGVAYNVRDWQKMESIHLAKRADREHSSTL